MCPVLEKGEEDFVISILFYVGGISILKKTFDIGY